ncbi:restriction endonuclease subunit S [Streptococcus suis]|nr:restriction endonuclease subunit S [Streptococcus suis]NQN72808.1 restriction endonuclease subunit S [Streptococcus suis]
MKTNNNIPAYRFQGYTDAWELRKLNNIADVRDGTHNSPRYIEFGYPLVTSKNIKNGQVNFEDIQYISSFDYEEINKRSKVNINDILMGMIGTVGNLALVREEPKFAIKNVALIKNIGVVNVEFLYHYLGSYVIERQLQNSLDGGTQKFISLNKIRHLDINFPTLPEQSAIGTFFSTLDRHITLHQRKLDTLKEQKKTYLKLLFPAKGQTKPALRFQGYTDAWELRKLGEVVEKSGSGGTPKSTNKAYYGGNIPFLSITDITQSGKYITNTEKTLTEIGLENSSAWIVPKGAISLAMYASVGKLAILKTDVATSQAFFNMVFSNEIVRDYVYFILDKAQLFNEWLPLISTGTQGNLNAQKLKEYIIPLPTLPEQEAIGTFFQTLDQEIAQVEDKLASLKEMKKTLLRKLFV